MILTTTKNRSVLLSGIPRMTTSHIHLASKMDLTAQMPHLKKENLKFHDYAAKQVSDLFSQEKLQQAISYTATNMESSILWTEDNGMRLESLPVEAQIAPVFGIVIEDIDNDGITDIYLGGNFYGLKPEVGRMDGNQGGYFKGIGSGEFRFVSNTQSGIRTTGGSPAMRFG